MQNIDLVIPMVFPQDPAWQEVYNKTMGNTSAVASAARFRSWGTEELLILCCMKYMPWLRTIYVLLASPTQVQPWMEQFKVQSSKFKIETIDHSSLPQVKLVFHEQFMPAEALPCFSSPCIEMFLHRIPDLSEYFIYANDDMFPLSPLQPEDFFQTSDIGQSQLLPCQELTECPYPTSPNLFHKACQGGLNMVAAPFGKHYTRTFMRNGHSFASFLKSSCEEVWRRHGGDIMAHLCPTKRKADSYNQYLYAYYQQFAGLYIAHAPRRQYISGKKTPEQLASVIRDPQAGIVCLNDNGSITDWEKRAAVVRREMEAKLQVPLSSAPSADASYIDVLIIHYNTPKLTAAAIQSLWKHTPNARVTVFDNSDQRPFCQIQNSKFKIQNSSLFTLIDNTKGQIVDWQKWLDSYPNKIPTPENNWGSAKHCYSVEVCMDRFPNGFVLMDSDVLIKQDISDLVDTSVPWKGGTHCNTRRYNVSIKRVIPFLCWINTPLLKQHNIRYYNGAKMWNMVRREPDCHYDTGAWLLEACNKAELKGAKIDIKPYIEHFAHGSWRSKKDPLAWLDEHKELWNNHIQNRLADTAVANSSLISLHSSLKYTVLTYIFGDYEKVHEVQERDPNADYILVTDNPNLKSDTWRVVLDPMDGMTTFEKVCQVRYNLFRYAETELCVRIDGSIGINRPLRPIIFKMQEGQYDRCLMLHPRRNTMPSEYAAWVRSRGYSQHQADRCMATMRMACYSMDYRGLFQTCFEVVRRNDVNTALNEQTITLLRTLAEDGHMERVDQTIFSFVLNRYYSDRLKVLPVLESIITDRRLMTWYLHATDRPNPSRQKIASYMFNLRCIPWRPLLP